MYTTPIEKDSPVNIRHLLGVTAASVRFLTGTRGKGFRWRALILLLTCGLLFMMGGAGLARAVTCGSGSSFAAGIDTPRHPADARPLPGHYIDGSVPEAWRLKTALDGHFAGRGFHLFSHGRPGELLLGGRWQSAGPIAAFVRRLPGFSGRGTLHIYGCSFAAGEKGRAAVRRLEQALGVPVAASDDVTGKNGDWDLEVGHSASVVRLPAYTRSLQTDTDGDGVPDSSDLDDDNDGIPDTDEGACSSGSMSFATFDSDNEGWIEDNRNNGNVGNPVAHSSDNTTTYGCPMSSIPAGPNGNFIAENDEDSYLMWFESPNDLNLDYSAALNGSFSFYWINGTFDGTGGQSATGLSLVLHGGGRSITGSVSVGGLHNTGSWHKLAIPLDDASWSGTAADLAAVLSDLDKVEIQVESMADRVRDCTNGEYFGLDDVVFACGTRDTDGDGIPDHLDPDSDNNGCPDAIEGARSPTYDFTDLVSGGGLDTAQYPVNSDGVPGGVTQGGGSSTEFIVNNCTDYGDAPDSYGTSSAGGNPAFSTIATNPTTLQPSFYLGTGVDLEADGRPRAGADGDDKDNQGDDEDGIAFSHDKQARTLTATATVVNNAGFEEGRLCCWLDGGTNSAAGAVSVDGFFAATQAEERCVDVPADSGSADYTLTWYFPAASTTTTYARCRLADTRFIISPIGAFDYGEVEDYRVTIEIDPCDPVSSGNTDTDKDGVSDVCDQDDDNDGIPDIVECGCDTGSFVNGSFEDSHFNAAFIQTHENNVPGWSTTATDNKIEIWKSGFYGHPSRHGDKFAELNASEVSTLYQEFCLPGAGGTVNWSLYHKGRDGVDVAHVKLGPTLADALAAAPAAVMSDGNTFWGYYSGTFNIPVGQTNLVIAFQSISSATPGEDANTYGNFLDDIQVLFDINCPDTDGDGTPDSRDLDSDNDGCPDAIEGDRSPTYDFTDLVSGGALDTTQHTLDSNGVPGDSQLTGSSGDAAVNGCTDYGDAPDTYGTTIAGGNPAVSIIATDPASLLPSSFYIGTGVDLEADGRPGTNADGDDTDGQGDDEAGVVFHYDNQVITATVTVVNNTDDEGLVCCWLDGGTASAGAALNITGTFEDTPDEERCAPVPANSGSADYTLPSWNFPVNAATNTYARCRLSTASDLSPTGAEGMSERGEVEDYLLRVRPTSAALGAFSVSMEPVEEFLAQLSGREDLLDLLEQYDPALAQTLAAAAAGALREALEALLDPDGDGLLAVVRWETLEERGTVGFYLERRVPGAAGFTRVNPALLLGLIDAPNGGQYWLADPGAGAWGTYRYRLVEQKAWGTQQTYDLGTMHMDPGRNGRQARRFTEAHGEAAGAFSAWKVLGPGYGARRHEPQPPRFEKVVAQLAARFGVQAEGLAAAQKSAEPSRRNWLYTDQPGLYRLKVEDLAGLTGMKSRTVRQRLARGRGRLLYKNQNTPYHFDAGTDAFYFVGTEYRTLYTDENAYRLLSSRSKGARMAVAGGGGPGAGAAAGTFTETLTIEEDALVGAVFGANADADYWFAGYAAKDRKGHDPLVVNLDLPDAAATGPMLLRLHIRGATGYIAGPDHRVRVLLNDTELGLWEWDGQAETVLEARADQSLLKPEGNVLKLKSEVAGTFQYFNRVEVRYQRRMKARAGSLWLDALPAGIHTVDGFDKETLVVIESPGTPKARWRKDITVAPSPGGGYEVSFAASRTADYLVAEADAALMPRVSADSPSRWMYRRAGADYLIIAPRELSATAEALKSYREERFTTVTIAWLEDLYDEFSYGRVDAGALEQFLFRVGWRWRQAPKYVVLLGNGTLDHRDRKGYSDSLIPVRMTTTPWGLFASDNRYADTDGDGVAEFALGRIPVSHDSEGLAYVAKLKAFEAAPSGAWTGRAVTAADNPDIAGDFHAGSDVIAEDLAQAGYSVRRAYHPDDAVQDILTDPETWESAYVNYVGHGSKTQLGHEGFLKNTDAASLTNTGLPLFAALTCAAGDDTHPGIYSVAGELVRNGGGGAVAALAPTGLSLDADAHILNGAFVKGLTAGRSLGDAWRESQQESLEEVSPFMLRIYQVMGDPAVALKK